MNDVAVMALGPLGEPDHYPGPGNVARGPLRCRDIRPPGHHLWAVEAAAEPGAELRFGREHGDEALYVTSGAVEVDGRRCGAEGAVIVESGAPAVVRVAEPARWLHFGSAAWRDLDGGPLGPPEPRGHGVHVVDPDDCFVLAATGTRYYADSSCPTCRVTLLQNGRPGPYRAASHVHSADELIYLLAGDMRLGRDVLEPGMAVAIPGGRRYAFTSEAGFEFLNFRAEASTYLGQPGDEPILETIASFPTA